MSRTNHRYPSQHCDLCGSHFEIAEGANTVPECVGVHLMCRGAVEYVGKV